MGNAADRNKPEFVFNRPTCPKAKLLEGTIKPDESKLLTGKKRQHHTIQTSGYCVIILIFYLLFHRRRPLPSGSLSNKTPPHWLPQRWQPCQAPPLRSWIRKRRIQKGRLWTKSDQKAGAVWMFEFDEIGKQ